MLVIDHMIRILIFVFLFAAAATAQIAINGTIGTAATTTGTTVTMTNYEVVSGTNQVLIVAVHLKPTDDDVTNSVTFNSTGLTKIGHAVFDNDARVELWYLLSPTVTTANIVATVSQSGNGKGLAAICFTGVNQTTPFGTAVTNTVDGSSLSVTVSSNTGEVVLGAFTCDGCSAAEVSVQSPSTERWEFAADVAMNSGATRDGASPNVAITYNTGNQSALIGVSIKPADSYNAATQVILINQ